MNFNPQISDLLWSGLKTFLFALALTPIFRDIFRSYNVMDRPGARKVHVHPIPRVGGIPIAIAYGLAIFNIFEWPVVASSAAWKLLPGALFIFAVGLVDDLFSLRPVVKLLGQIGVAAMTFMGGLRIETLGHIVLAPWVSLPLTIFWLLLTMNALNLIDGLDGLCAGMGLLSTMTLFGVAILQENYSLAAATLPLAAALLGFLFYNYNPATIFLGDSGALLIGYLLGCFGMLWTQKKAILISIAIPLLSLSIPLLDLSLSVVRRFLANKSIFGADRGHIHHRLLDLGFSPRRAVGTLYLFAAGAACVALLLIAPQTGRHGTALLLVFGLLCSLAIWQLGYAEFNAAAQFLLGGLRGSFAWRMRLETLAARLRTSSTQEEWWKAITTFAREVGWLKISWQRRFDTVSEVLNSQSAASPAVISEAVTAWSFRIDLPGGESLTVSGPPSRPGEPEVELIHFAGLVKRSWRTGMHSLSSADEPAA